MLLQAVVDHTYLFTDVCVGWPGSVHDARVLANSSLYKKVSQRKILCGENVKVSGIDIPLFVVGDSAYPLRSWLMKPLTPTLPLVNGHLIFTFPEHVLLWRMLLVD